MYQRLRVFRVSQRGQEQLKSGTVGEVKNTFRFVLISIFQISGKKKRYVMLFTTILSIFFSIRDEMFLMLREISYLIIYTININLL